VKLGVDTPKIAIIGRGLIGRSIELALLSLEAPPEVVALDMGDDLSGAAGARMVFLCAPISENIRILGDLHSHVPGAAVVTDTGSTKRTTCAAAAALPSRLMFVGGHPMAGAAVAGTSQARADLFAGRPWILTPTSDTNPEQVGRLRTVIESMGARIRMMDAAEHDRVVAYVSHLPQLVISALMQTVGSKVEQSGLEIAGAGLRDSTRLASSPAALWREIVKSNADAINPALDAMIGTLEDLRDRGPDALPEIFSESARWKHVLDTGAGS
jgi:prephenate dehydrogenase